MYNQKGILSQVHRAWSLLSDGTSLSRFPKCLHVVCFVLPMSVLGLFWFVCFIFLQTGLLSEANFYKLLLLLPFWVVCWFWGAGGSCGGHPLCPLTQRCPGIDAAFWKLGQNVGMVVKDTAEKAFREIMPCVQPCLDQNPSGLTNWQEVNRGSIWNPLGFVILSGHSCTKWCWLQSDCCIHMESMIVMIAFGTCCRRP